MADVVAQVDADYPGPVERMDLAIAATPHFKLSSPQSAFLKHILHRAGREFRACWDSQENIAKACGYSKATLGREMPGLERLGLIRIRRRYSATTVYLPNIDLLRGISQFPQDDETGQNPQFPQDDKSGRMTTPVSAGCELQFPQDDDLTGKELEIKQEEREEDKSPSLSHSGDSSYSHLPQNATNGPAYSLETPPAHFDIGYLRWAWAAIASDFDWRNHLGKFITDYRDSWDSLAADIPGWIEARDQERADFEQEEADELAEYEAQQQREADALARAEERERERIAADALINAGLTPHQWAWRNGVCADLNRDARFLGGIHRDVEITGVYLEGATLVLPCRTATTPQRWAERMAGKHAEVMEIIAKHLPDAAGLTLILNGTV